MSAIAFLFIGMKLIMLHGPPAAGKLTVANAIAARTGYKVFHNHLTIDCTRPVFDFGSDGFWRINHRLRCEVIAEAARQGINVISTVVYAKGTDDISFHELIDAAESNGGAAYTVLLTCRNDIRRQRIGNESRVRLRKLTNPDSVDPANQQHDLQSPLPGRETLTIDNSDLEAEECASRIITALGLTEAANTET